MYCFIPHLISAYFVLVVVVVVVVMQLKDYSIQL